MPTAQYLTIAAIYESHQEMWDGGYSTPESSDFALVIIRHTVLDIGKQNGKAVQHILLRKLMAFPACKENLGRMKESLAALETLQDL